MKNKKIIAIAMLLFLAVGIASAQSLGDYAREVRKNKDTKAEIVPASRQFDNDNLPTGAGLSVVGPAPDSDAKSAAPAFDPAAERQKTAAEWNKKIDEQKAKVDTLNHELDLAQREYRLRAAEMYSDPTGRLRNPAQWESDDAKFKADIDAKQKALDDARQQYDSMQEQAHKAGIAPESSDKDSSKQQDKNPDQAKSQNQGQGQGQSQGQDQNKQ
jgi:hypothetical protein